MLSIEPDIHPSPKVTQAIIEATQANKIRYTESLGLFSLREKISAHYHQNYNVTTSPHRIALMVGTSGAFLVTYAILLNAGEQLLLTDPAYPCYKNFSYLLNNQAVFVPIDETTDYQLTVEQLKRYKNIKAIQISSPSNPIGNIYDSDVLADLIGYCDKNDIYFISDEIYHGLTYDIKAQTALDFSDNAIVINGFSKYFCLPGLRLGWVILPENLVRKAEVVMQNLYISAPTLSQHGALAAFDEQYLVQVKTIYQQRRDFLYQALSQLFDIPVKPMGAFYILADVSRYTQDSLQFAEQLLSQAHVAVTPGIDFGQHRTQQFMRFAYTREIDHLRQGVTRLCNFLNA